MIVDLYEEQHIHNSIKLYRLANVQKIHLSYIINDFPPKKNRRKLPPATSWHDLFHLVLVRNPDS